ncbi:MAG: polysaccharide biosynthesis protein [Peptostreptococcaceae bacterium]|nr:polysaccharide biosynthesis protein [Peptostreptococcaceae bacterium]
MKQSIGSDVLKLSASKIITMTISLITAMLLSRFRTLEEYGTYSQILLVINLATAVFMLGLPNSINFFLARAENEKEKERFISTYYTLSTILSFLTGLVLFLATPLIVKYFDNQLISSFWYVLAVYPWTKIILSSIDNILIVYKKTYNLLVFRVLNGLFLLGAVIIVQLLNLSFFEYMAIVVMGESVFSIITYVIVNKLAGRISFLFDKHLIKLIFTFSIPIGIGSVVGTLTKEFDKLVIAGFYNTEQLAIYTNAAREIPVTIIAVSITAVLMPQIVRMLKKDEKCEAINLWGDSIALSYLIICFLASGFFTYAPEVMTLLYSTKYISGVPVFRVYSIVLLCRCTYFGMILNSAGKTKVILYSSIIALAINVVLNFIFYYLFGFIGPAIATVIATVICAMYLLIETSKTMNISFKKIFPWKSIGTITILNVVLSIVFCLLKNVLTLDQNIGEVMESLTLGLVWGVCYMSITFRFAKSKWLVLNDK